MEVHLHEAMYSIVLAVRKGLGYVLLTAISGTLVTPMGTNAAPLTRTYEGTASGFVDGILISPYSTVNFAFTVTFDPLMSTGPTGLVAVPVDAYNGTLALPDFGPWVFQYNAGAQTMVIGDHCLSISATECSFTVSAVDAIFRLTLTDPDNPVFSSMTLRATGTRPTGGTQLGTFSATVRTINGTTTSTVPEPGTLLLLGLGFAGLGLSRLRAHHFARATKPYAELSHQRPRRQRSAQC